VYGDGIMGVHVVRNWCREFENGQIDIYDDYSAHWLSTTRMDMNAAQVEAHTLED
jgi:hypothetical protein